MADDIVLTVQVRDMTRGDFQRLDRQLDRLRRNVRDVGSASNGASQRFDRLNQSLGAVQGRMRRLLQTGTMTSREMTHMRQSLSQVNREMLNAARSGEITRDQYRALRNEADQTRNTFDGLSRDIHLYRTRVNGAANSAQRLRMQQDRLRLAWVRSNQTATRLTQTQTRLAQSAQRMANQQQNAAIRLRQADDRLRLANMRLAVSSQKAGDSGQFMGGAFTKLRQKLIATGVVLGVTLLPTIGALAPMLAGVGMMAGVAALAFMGLDKPTKFLTKDQKEFLKAIRPVTKEFERLQKTARSAILPKFVKSAGDMKKAVRELNPALKIAGDSFGDLVGKIARGVGSERFMKPFTKNVKMGSEWVHQFAGSFGEFSIKFFEFGTKSKPALDAWQSLFGGFLDTGMPSMFKELERGIGGSSTYLKDFAGFINGSLLPVLGRVAAGFMKAFGPLLGQMLRLTGNWLKIFGGLFMGWMEALAPVTNTVADAFKALNMVFEIGLSTVGNLAKAIGGMLFGALAEVTGTSFTDLQGGFEGFSKWVKENESSLRAMFTQIGIAIIDMVNMGVSALPALATAFQYVAVGIMTWVDGIISTLATLGEAGVPGLEWAVAANEAYDEWANGAKESLQEVVDKTTEFAKTVDEKSRDAKLHFETSQARDQLNSVLEMLKNPDLTKERRAKLTADAGQLATKVAEGEDKLKALGQKVSEPKIDAEPKSFWEKIKAAIAKTIPKKSAVVDANTDPFRAGVGGIIGRAVGSAWINVYHNMVDSKASPTFKSANGNVFRSFANGGKENHVAQIADGGPIRVWAEEETGGEAYLPLGPSKRSRSRRVAEQAVGIMGGQIEWFAKGGIRSEARQAIGPIKAATSGATEKSLLRLMSSIIKGTIKLATALKSVTSALDKAKSKLSELRNSASSLSSNVKSGTMTDVTSGVDSGKAVTMSALMSRMTVGRDKATAFASALKQLRKRGLSKGLLRQVAEAGVGGGGLETAGALLRASGSELKSINSLHSQMSGAASSAGKTTADAIYGAQIKVQEKLVKSLDELAKELKAATKKAEARAKAKAKAKRKATGGIVGAASGGARGGLTLVGEHEPELVRLPFGSTVHSGPDSRRIAGSMGDSGGGIFVIPISIGGKLLDEVILDSNRRTVRTRGGNVQAVFGR